MDIEIKEKVVPKKFLVTNGKELDLYQFLNDIEMLDETSMLSPMIFDNTETEKWVIENGYAQKNSRGSYYKTEKYDKEMKNIIDEIYSQLEKLDK